MWFANPRIYTRLVALWLALSILGLVVALDVWWELHRSLADTARQENVAFAVGELRAVLDRAAWHERTYLLTGDQADLAAFGRAEAAVPALFARLADAAPTSGERERIFRLRSDTDRRLDDLRRAAAARRTGRSAAEAERAADAAPHAERLERLLGELDQRPADLFSPTGMKPRAQLRRAFLTTLFAGFLGFGAGALAFFFARIARLKEERERFLAGQAVRAERTAQEKSRFLANMSHEIRTPMNAILGFSELLAAELPEGGRARRYAQSIRESSQSLLQLINDVLDLSKVEAGMIELHVEPAGVGELVEFLRTVFMQQASRKGLALSFEVAENLPSALLLDRSRLRQVLVNLIGNAIKFTDRGGVSVRTSWNPLGDTQSRGTLTFEIADTGVGIPPAKHEEIFQPFAQVDPTRAAEKEGTGLGLSIVKRLVDRMGGTIDLQSTPGEGSTFYVRLTGVAISARLPSAARYDWDEPVDFNQLAPASLLVVDDNATNRELLAGLFANTHHRVRFASNGREALASVRDDRPDLVLMDIRMPEMDGRTALQEIHRLPGSEILPIIAVTASSLLNDEHLIRGLFAGYVRKPFTRNALFREMAEFLPRQRPAPAVAGSALGAGAPASVEAETPDRWPELVTALREFERSIWPAVRDGGAINETKEFAARLEALGSQAGCPTLRAYAADLLEDASHYAVVRMEARLQEFPRIIAAIAARAAVPAAAG